MGARDDAPQARSETVMNLPRRADIPGPSERLARSWMRATLTLSTLALVLSVAFTGAAEGGTNSTSPSPTPLSASSMTSSPPSPPSPGRCMDACASGAPDCGSRAAELRALVEELAKEWKARLDDFQAQFAAARADYARGSHSDDEWKAFLDHWHEEGQALHQEAEKAARELAQEHGLAECFESMGTASVPVPDFTEPAQASQTPMDPGLREIQDRCAARAREAMKHDASSASYSYATGYGNGYPPSSYATATSPPRPSAATAAGTSTGPRPGPAAPAALEEIRHACDADVRSYMERQHAEAAKEGFGSFQVEPSGDGLIHVDGRCIDLTGHPASQTMTDVKVNGKVFIDRLAADGLLAQFRMEATKDGGAIQVFDASGRHVLGVHDDCRSVLRVESSDAIPAFTIDLPDDFVVEKTEHGVAFHAGERRGELVLDDGTVQVGAGNVLHVVGKATFFAFGGDAAIDEAAAQKKVAAEVKVAKDGKSQDISYTGDLDVHDLQVAAGGFSAKVDSADGSCKTVVFHAETGLVSSADVRVSVKETDVAAGPLTVEKAASLEAVLDPCGHGRDTVTYWVVEDQDGLQVLVSFPHFSEKLVTIESGGRSSPFGALPGAASSLAVAAVALLAVGLRRRR